jgi:glycosyltransferase involved in cell wall biosynthesis
MARINICMLTYSDFETDSRMLCYVGSLSSIGCHVDVVATRNSASEQTTSSVQLRIDALQTRSFKAKPRIAQLVRVVWFCLKAFCIITARELRRHYDVVHVHSVPEWLVLCTLVPKLRGSKIILDLHDLVPELYATKFSGRKHSIAYELLVVIEKFCISRSDHVIVANDLWLEKVRARSAPHRKCMVMLSVPDRTLFRRKTDPSQREPHIVLYPGSLSYHQGVDIAIKAIHRVRSRFPNLEVHIYGWGPEEQSLRQLVTELGVTEGVKFMGACSLFDIPRVMEGADIGIVPKRNCEFAGEAFSTKTLEFMAMGIPVVTARTKIDAHYFDECTVRFFEPGDDASLASALIDVVQSERLRRQLVENGRRFVESHDWKTNEGRYLELVASLIGRAGHGS